MKKLYTIKNTGKDERRFWNKHVGSWVVLKPRESTITSCLPEKNHCFEIEELKEEGQSKKKKPKEDDV